MPKAFLPGGSNITISKMTEFINETVNAKLLISHYNSKRILSGGLMKIAATYEKETGNVFQHFGKTQYFKIYEIEDGKILSSEVIDNGGNGHHALPPFLKSLGVETLILGNRGQGAIDAIAAAGLKEGDEVIVPANTYIATILAITENGLKPVLIEPRADTLEINDSLIEAAINAIAAAGLKEVPGITGSADEAAEKFAKGQLKGNFEARCDHHGEHHNH